MSLIAQQMDSEIKIVPNSYCAENLQNFQKCFDLVYKNLNTVQAKHTNVLNIPHYFEVGEEVLAIYPSFKYQGSQILHRILDRTLHSHKSH